MKNLTKTQMAIYKKAENEEWFEHVKKNNLYFKFNSNVKGLLTDLRAVFPNNFVDKEKRNKMWIYTVYKGDKELMKALNTPIQFENPKKEMMDYMSELK